MTKRKPKQTLYRDERGRFVSASVKIQEALAAMRGKPMRFKESAMAEPQAWKLVSPEFTYSEHRISNPVTPVRKSWLERVIRRVIWNRSRV